MKHHTAKLCVAAIIIAAASTGCQSGSGMPRNQSPLYIPEPIVVPAGMTLKEVNGAVRRSLLAKNWLVQKNENNHIEASYRKSKDWSIAIVVQYDIQSIRINYKDSNGLNYDTNTGSIHKRYTEMVGDLEKVIRGQVRE
jgi:hypothetical protein